MEYQLNADDPYDVLGLGRDATADEIKERARELLDKYSDDHSARVAINEAFVEVMENPSPVEFGDTTIVPLLVSVNPDTIEVGEEVEIQVTDHRDNPIPGARISVDEQTRGRTDEQGRETIRFNDHGSFRITAHKLHSDSNHEFRETHAEVLVE